MRSMVQETRSSEKRDRVSSFRLRLMGNLEEYKLQKTVRMLEERMEEMSRICVLEGNSDGEEMETSSSDGGY